MRHISRQTVELILDKCLCFYNFLVSKSPMGTPSDGEVQCMVSGILCVFHCFSSS